MENERVATTLLYWLADSTWRMVPSADPEWEVMDVDAAAAHLTAAGPNADRACIVRPGDVQAVQAAVKAQAATAA